MSYSGLNSVILCLSLSYSGLNSGISFLGKKVFRLLFYQTTLSYSGLNSVILYLSLSYSGLNSVILVSTQVFHF
jgi:hypothetical protein